MAANENGTKLDSDESLTGEKRNGGLKKTDSAPVFVIVR